LICIVFIDVFRERKRTRIEKERERIDEHEIGFKK